MHADSCILSPVVCTAAVGKTCLLVQLTDKRFLPGQDFTVGKLLHVQLQKNDMNFYSIMQELSLVQRWLLLMRRTLNSKYGTQWANILLLQSVDWSIFSLLTHKPWLCVHYPTTGRTRSFSLHHQNILQRSSWYPPSLWHHKVKNSSHIS